MFTIKILENKGSRIKRTILQTSLLVSGYASATIDEYLNTNSIHENGFGDIEVGQTIIEASKTSGINIKDFHVYSEQGCGSYIVGKGGTLNIERLILED